MREQDLSYVVEREEQSIRVLGLFPASSLFCVVVRCRVEGELSRKASARF